MFSTSGAEVVFLNRFSCMALLTENLTFTKFGEHPLQLPGPHAVMDLGVRIDVIHL
jgi:hypothetical protein